MDRRLELELFTSAELAGIIVDAGQILRMRALASATDGPTTADSPTNKIPRDRKPWAEANEESGGGARQFQSGHGFSGNRTQDCQGDPWTEGNEDSGAGAQQFQSGNCFSGNPTQDWPGGPKSKLCLGGGFKHFLFSPLPGEMILFD